MKLKILPNSLWVAYKLTDPDIVSDMIPKHLELTKVSPLSESKEHEMLLFNAYAIRSRWMNGHRIDIQTFARDKKHGTPHLVILDVITDTMSWDPIHGITPPNAQINYSTNNLTAVSLSTTPRLVPSFSVCGNPSHARKLNYDFAVNANRKSYYRDVPLGYEMTFKEQEIMKDVLDFKNLRIINTHWESVRKSNPEVVFRHQQPMDFTVKISPMFFELRKLF
tara:strand:- start:146 stop:811 length:666 start_codon:yes stop_codon:yes gene_type:complete